MKAQYHWTCRYSFKPAAYSSATLGNTEQQSDSTLPIRLEISKTRSNNQDNAGNLFENHKETRYDLVIEISD